VEASEWPVEVSGTDDGGGCAVAAAPAGRRWLGWVGLGLVAVGLVCGMWALRSPVAPARASLPWGSSVGLVVPALALAVAGVAARRRDRNRRWVLVGAVVSAVCAVSVVRAARADVDGGLPRMAVPLSAVALLWVTLGCFLLVLAAGRVSPAGDDVLGPWASRRRGSVRPGDSGRLGRFTGRRWVGAGVAVAVGLAASVLAVGGSWALEHPLAVDATTAPPPGDAPRPAVPGRVAWTWEQSGEARGLQPGLSAGFNLDSPRDVVAAGTGLAVNEGDGVVALDGVSGEERWHYRRPGARVRNVNASLSGEWVVAQFEPGTGGAPGAVWIVALDGATGEVGLDVLAASDTLEGMRRGTGGIVADPGRRSRGEMLTWVTDNTLVNLDDARQRLVGYDLATGERSWEWRLPDDGCEYGVRSDDMVVGQDTMITSAACGTSDELVALDDRTGDERWRASLPDLGDPPAPEVSPTGDVVMVEAGPGETVFDTATGEPVPSRGQNRRVPGQEPDPLEVAIGDTGLVVDHRTARPDTFELIDNGDRAATVTLPDCGVADDYATAADALIVVCIDVDDDSLAEDRHPTALHVVPWGNPDSARTIDIEPLQGAPTLIVTPHVIAVTGHGSTRLAVLGPA
jgi:hypothetical protein